MKHIIAALLTIVLAVSMTAVVSAGDIADGQDDTFEYTFEAPTEPMEVDDNIITASAHRGASPSISIMGLNATSGMGMVNGGAPDDLAGAEASAALGVWGSSLNDNPDPYYWNYFYNYYAVENGLAISDDALINSDLAAGPFSADTTLFEEYGNISVSLSTRPDLLVGVAGSGGGDYDTSGYDEQLATIHSFTPDSPYYQEGDEDYNPQLISYTNDYIKQMIETARRIADAVDIIKEETGKTTRYEDPHVIAADYETLAYGAVTYVKSRLAEEGLPEKVFAVVTTILDSENNVVTEIDESKAGTYKYAVSNHDTSDASTYITYEYAMGVGIDLLDAIACEDVDVTTTSTGRDGTETTTTTTYHVYDLDTILQTDVIITMCSSTVTEETLNASFGDRVYDGIEITNAPSTLYGIYRSPNDLGYAYVIGCMYSEYLNPVDLCAYYYQHFFHISEIDNIEKVVKVNFAQTTLPGELENTLSDSYNSDSIDACMLAGAQYYNDNKDEFTDERYVLIGLSDWYTDYELEGSILYNAAASQTAPGPAEEPTDTTEVEPGPVEEPDVTEAPDTTETEPGPVETEAPATTVTESGPETSASSGIATWVWVVIIVIVVVVVIIIVAVVVKKKKK